MRIESFRWNEWNLEHIDRHFVTAQEVEEACFNPSIIRKTKNGLYIIYGQTDAGRYLVTIVRYEGEGQVYVITARPMNNSERKYYQKER